MFEEIINTIAEGKMSHKCDRNININELRTFLNKLGYTFCCDDDITDNSIIILTFIANY